MNVSKLVAQMTESAVFCQQRAQEWERKAAEATSTQNVTRYLRYAAEETGGAKAWQLAIMLVTAPATPTNSGENGMSYEQLEAI